ncbi:MAG: CHAT domain-containing protein [Pyrinomonadaceae bacterium]
MASAQEVTTLSPGQPTTRQIKGGEKDLFQFAASVGQYIHVAVRPTHIILQVTLFDPAGKQLVTTNNPSGGTGPIFVSEIAALSGDYRVEVRSTESWANQGTVEISVAELRASNSEDIKLVEAERWFAKALEESDARAYSNAIEHYQKALSHSQSVHDAHWEALTRYSLGQIYYLMRNLVDSDANYKKILDISLSPDDWRIRAAALNDLGLNARIQGNNERAISFLNESLKIFADHSDRRGQASALNNLGSVYGQVGDLRVALNLVERAIPLREAENFQSGVNTLKNTLGTIYDRLGDPYKALAYHTEALQGWQQLANSKQLDNPDRLGNALNGVAIVNAKLGQWDKAAQYYDDALKVPNTTAALRAAILNNRADFYASLGDFPTATRFLNEAKALLQSLKAPEPDTESSILWQLAQIHLVNGELDDAVSALQQARTLKQNRPKRAYVLTALGEAHSRQGNFSEALEAYQEALDIQLQIEDLRGQALTHHKLGDTLAGTGDTATSAKHYASALSLWRAVVDLRGEAATLNSMALLERDRNNMEQALRDSEQATQILESLRTNVSNYQLRTLYFASHENYYELNIDLKMMSARSPRSQESLAAALAASEKSRARSLMDTLLEGRALWTADANNDLVRSEREIDRRLRAKFDSQTVLLSTKHKESEAKSISEEISELIKQQDNVRAKMRAGNPKFLELTQPRLLTLSGIQRQLDADTLLVEFALGDKRSYVWVVSSTSIYGFELPSRNRIEPVAQRFSEALTARNQELNKESSAERQIRLNQAGKDFSEAAAALNNLVIEPIAAQLGQKRLVIVADGALQLIPFGALPVSPSSRDLGAQKTRDAKSTAPNAIASGGRYLLDDHEIIMLPSASVLALQRREIGNRKPAAKAVAVLADPVFDAEDVRVAQARRQNKVAPELPATARKKQSPTDSTGSHSFASLNPNTTFATARRDVGLDGKLHRLLLSRQEARSIMQVAPAGQSMSALDFKASRETALGAELAEYRIVHFATHGVLDMEHPELSGVALSMIDANGKPQDGHLRLYDIYNLNLSADLVVLSACQTGIGKQIKGEGLIALTRGFMYAGAKSIVASLWKVDDAATSALMAEFYRQMFINKLKPSAALRAAQLKLAQQPRWQSPYYWAGFFIQGDWN